MKTARLGHIVVPFKNALLRVAGLIVLVNCAVAAQSVTGSGTALRGIVRDSSGNVVPFVYIKVIGSDPAFVIANSAGEFVIPSPPRAPFSIIARKIGFAPTTEQVTSSSSPVAIVLQPLVTQLEASVTSASGYDESLDRDGFYSRMQRGVDGTFISPAEIERRNPSTVSQLLRNIPGVRVVSANGRAGKSDTPLGRGGLCALGLVVDGVRVEYKRPTNAELQPRIQKSLSDRNAIPLFDPAEHITERFDEIISATDVKAIEVYPSPASVPGAFQHLVDGCGLVVVWSRGR